MILKKKKSNYITQTVFETRLQPAADYGSVTKIRRFFSVTGNTNATTKKKCKIDVLSSTTRKRTITLLRSLLYFRSVLIFLEIVKWQ